MRRRIRRRKGQAIIEFCLSAFFLTAVLMGFFLLLSTQWHRLHCLKLAFEKAHRLRPLLEETGEAVSSTVSCGKLRETVTLPLLDPTK